MNVIVWLLLGYLAIIAAVAWLDDYLDPGHPEVDEFGHWTEGDR